MVPSVGVALRLVPKPSSTLKFSLITEVDNYLQPVGADPVLVLGGVGVGVGVGGGGGGGFNGRGGSDGGDALLLRERLSSVGQLDILNLSTDHFLEIDENAVKVMGIWMLGGARPFKYKTAASASASTSASTSVGTAGVAASGSGRGSKDCTPALLASPLERAAHCFSVKRTSFTNTSRGAVSKGEHRWLLPLPRLASASTPGFSAQSSLHDDTHASTSDMSNVHIVRVVEQFLCISSARQSFEAEVVASRALVQAEELEAETMGPRSIAQVRRDKATQQRKQEQAQLQMVQRRLQEIDLLGEDGLEDVNLSATDAGNTTLKLGAVPGEAPPLAGDGYYSLLPSMGGPKSAREVATLEASKCSMKVAVLWMLRWEGKLRWGMHLVSDLSFRGDRLCATVGDNLTSSFTRTHSRATSAPAQGLRGGTHVGIAGDSSAATAHSASSSGRKGSILSQLGSRPPSSPMPIAASRTGPAPTLSEVGAGAVATAGPSSSSVSGVSTAAVVSASKAAPKAADCLLVGLCHDSVVQLCPARESGVPLRVTLRLQSLSAEELSVSVLALDYNSPTALLGTGLGSTAAGSGGDGGGGGSGGGAGVGGASSDSAVSISPGSIDTATAASATEPPLVATPPERVPDLGMKWNAKTQHVGIVVPPLGCREVHLVAMLTKPGVYDLNR